MQRRLCLEQGTDEKGIERHPEKDETECKEKGFAPPQQHGNVILKMNFLFLKVGVAAVLVGIFHGFFLLF
jgi:hypothetical protein